MSVRAIKSKIGSVKNIKKITKAMEMVSVSKMQKAVAATLRTREYAHRALEVLAHVSHNRFLRFPLLHVGAGDKELVVVVASNKGLCGGFNASIRKRLRDLAKKTNAPLEVIAIGRYAEIAARGVGLRVAASFIDLPEEVHVTDIHAITSLIRNEFEEGDYKHVYMLYTTYKSALVQRPKVRTLLPITEEVVHDVLDEVVHMEDDAGEPQAEPRSLALYMFEPGEIDVAETIIPRLVEMVLYQAILESRASEHSARMIAMKNATDNAKSLVDTLTLRYNKLRQASITQEIAEISSAAEALG